MFCGHITYLAKTSHVCTGNHDALMSLEKDRNTRSLPLLLSSFIPMAS